MYKIFKIIFNSSRKSFIFISFIIFISLFSFIFTWNIINSINDYIKDNSKDFLWADLVIRDRENFLEEASSYILENNYWEVSKKLSFNTSIFYEWNSDLYSIYYIDFNYPFYWSFKENLVNESWDLIVSKDVYDKFLDKNIEILWKQYKIKSYLEEDFLADFNPFSWNDIYIYFDNLDLSWIENISRISYELLVKTQKVNEIKNDSNLKKYRINTQETSNNNLNEIINRFNVFIQIFYQIVILLSFFIITISMNSYFKKITKDLKIINILGFSIYKIIFILFMIFLLISVLSSSLSYFLVYFIFDIFWKNFEILSMDLTLLYKSIFLSFLIICSWSFLNLINLKATWMNSFGKVNMYVNYKKYIISYFIFLLLIIFFIAYFSGVSWVSSVLISVWFISFILFIIFILNKLLKIIFNLIKNKISNNFYLFDSLRSTIKPGNLSIIIIISTFVSISWFLIFSTISNWFIDFLDKNTKWQIDTFVINIDSDDLEIINKNFDSDDYYEILKSRILTVNWVNLKDYLWVERVPWNFSREFNTTTKPLSEIIIEWKEIESWYVWIDEEFATELWVKIWDKIKFLVLWIEKELTIIQIRDSTRDWLAPYFYFNFYAPDFDWFSSNYFLSYDSKEKPENFNFELSKELWDGVTFINISTFIEKIKNISVYILYFVYVILWYIWIFSIITFLVSIRFLKSFKKSKINIYSKFGWNKGKLTKFMSYEYLYLIILWLIISIIFSFVIIFILFSGNRFLDFEIKYFINSLYYIFIFLLIYVFSYFVLNK